MDFLDIVRSRRSIRSYKDYPVPDEDIEKILDSARWAPSAGNLQPWEFIIVRNDRTKRLLAEAAYGQFWIMKAPVVIVACANIPRTSRFYGNRGANLYCIQDVAAAIQNILLSAHYLGYGTCWVGAFSEEEVRRILRLPEHVRPLAIITLGKPAEKPAPPPRRSLKEIAHFEKW